MKIAVLGAGGRGFELARQAARHAPFAEVLAVAEPRKEARETFVKEFNLAAGAVFESWQDFFKNPPQVEAVIIATMDREHLQPAILSLERGWHVLLEKPMAPSWEDCMAIEAAQRRGKASMVICHSLRYHQAFQKAREIAQSGKLGSLMSMDLLEQVGYWHFAHSFVRGNWRREDESAFVLLAKSCHDMDYLSWLAGRACLRVSSFGERSHFRSENAPAGATKRCAEGCPVKDCAYDARKIYSRENQGWSFVAHRATVLGISEDETRQRLLQDAQFGRCVYHSDNDVADHQGVLLEFEGGLVATFTLTAFTQDCARRLRVQGTEGEMEMWEEGGGQRLKWRRFDDKEGTEVLLEREEGSHSGADARLVSAWVQSLKTGDRSLLLSDAQASLASHRIAFAAEASRKEGRMISVQDYAAAQPVVAATRLP
jgi:predicted dehydrogenase